MALPKISMLIFFLICIITLSHLTPNRAQNSPQDYLNAHNDARNAVGAGIPNMTWSSTLESYATSFIQSRLLDCNFTHSNGSYGENLAKGGGTFTGAAAVKLWTDEKSCYAYPNNSCIYSSSCPYGCLHYTQVVWRNSVSLGCAWLQCTNGWWFVSCSYDPPGNYFGQTPY